MARRMCVCVCSNVFSLAKLALEEADAYFNTVTTIQRSWHIIVGRWDHPHDSFFFAHDFDKLLSSMRGPSTLIQSNSTQKHQKVHHEIVTIEQGSLFFSGFLRQ